MGKQENEEEQGENPRRDREQKKQNNGKRALPNRSQPDAASDHSCQSGQDQQPGQNVERSYPITGRQRKKEIERYRGNKRVDTPEAPKPKLHDLCAHGCFTLVLWKLAAQLPPAMCKRHAVVAS